MSTAREHVLTHGLTGDCLLQHVLLYNVKGVTYDDYLQARCNLTCCLTVLTHATQPLEKAELVREGKQCTILTYSRMRFARRTLPSVRMVLTEVDLSYVVEQAVKEAVAAGYDPEVIDLISLKPFDQFAISVRSVCFISVSPAHQFTFCPDLCAQDAPCHHCGGVHAQRGHWCVRVFMDL
jgi:hypothetical protein